MNALSRAICIVIRPSHQARRKRDTLDNLERFFEVYEPCSRQLVCRREADGAASALSSACPRDLFGHGKEALAPSPGGRGDRRA